MIRIIAYISFCIILVNSVSAQHYFSKIIEIEEPSFLFENLYIKDGKYIIPYDFGNDTIRSSYLLETDLVSEQKYLMKDKDLALNPMLEVNGFYYLVGENFATEADDIVFVCKIDPATYEEVWYKEYPVHLDWTLNLGFQYANGHLYTLNSNYYSEYDRVVEIMKITLDGDLVDKRLLIFEDSDKQHSTNQFLALESGDMTISQNYYDNPRIIKINKDLDIVWVHTLDDEISHGTGGALHTELSNGNIVYDYVTTRRDDRDYIINEWDITPQMLQWINSEGQPIQRIALNTFRLDNIIVSGLEKGRHGDYFFVYGRLSVYNEGVHLYNFLTKYSNEGDTIWTRLYRHQDFIGVTKPHYPRDILEKENGDIVILSEVGNLGEKRKIWLFQVNSEGCNPHIPCEEDIVITSAEEEEALTGIKIYPNPTDDYVSIDWPLELSVQQLYIYDLSGQLVYEEDNPQPQSSIDLSLFTTGLYYIKLIGDDGKEWVEKLVVE